MMGKNLVCKGRFVDARRMLADVIFSHKLVAENSVYRLKLMGNN